MQDRSHFYDDAGWRAHLEREVEAAQIRGDKKSVDAAERELARLHGHRGAVKRPSRASETR